MPRKAEKKPKDPVARVAGGAVTFSVDAKAWGTEAVLGAAYLLTDRCFVALDGDRSRVVKISLRPRQAAAAAGLKALAALFVRELHTQRLRWAIAKNNLPVREYVAKQAVLLAGGAAQPAPPADELSAEQRKEIDDLIAEVEAEIKSLKDKKAASDPKGIAATWEERHGSADHPPRRP